MLRIFIGYDFRQPVAANVLEQSIFERCSVPVSLTRLMIDTMPVKRIGETLTTYSRYLVPYLCDYKGWALYLEPNMLVIEDLKLLFDLKDPKFAAQVVHNDPMYLNEWGALILYNNEKCQQLTPDFVRDASPEIMKWGAIGHLPEEWRHMVGIDAPREPINILHYPMGIPLYNEVHGFGAEQPWFDVWQRVQTTCCWAEYVKGDEYAKRVFDNIGQRARTPFPT